MINTSMIIQDALQILTNCHFWIVIYEGDCGSQSAEENFDWNGSTNDIDVQCFREVSGPCDQRPVLLWPPGSQG